MLATPAAFSTSERAHDSRHVDSRSSFDASGSVATSSLRPFSCSRTRTRGFAAASTGGAGFGVATVGVVVVGVVVAGVVGVVVAGVVGVGAAVVGVVGVVGDAGSSIVDRKRVGE